MFLNLSSTIYLFSDRSGSLLDTADLWCFLFFETLDAASRASEEQIHCRIECFGISERLVYCIYIFELRLLHVQ